MVQPSSTASTVARALSQTHKAKKANFHHLNRDIYECYIRKDFDKCLSLMKMYQTTTNKRSEFHLYLLGLICRQFVQFDKSLNYFKQCYMMDKLNFEYLKEMAKGMFLNGKFKAALDPAKDAAKLNEDQEVVFLIAQIELSLGNVAAAKEYFEKSIEIEPTDEAYMKLAEIHLKMDNKQQSLTALQEGLKSAPENTNLLDTIGLLFLRMEKPNQAQEYFLRSLEINQKDTVAMLALGYLLQERQEIEDATAQYRKMHSLSPNSPQLWSNVGLCFMAKNKNLAAYCCIRKSIFLNPFEWKSSANMGVLCLKMKKYALASVYFTTALTLDSKNSQVTMMLGVSLTYLQDYNNAEAAFKQAIRMEKNSVDVSGLTTIHLNYFKMLIRKGDQKKAEEVLSDMVKFKSEIGEAKLEELKVLLYQTN